MDFNSRTSQHFRTGNMSTTNHNGGGGGRTATTTKKREEDSNAFMRLPDKEIAGCISDIGVPFTVGDLQKPNPQQIQMVFEWFAELLMNATRETVEPAMRAAAQDVCGEHADLVSADTRNLMGFFVSLRRLLLECGITDFSFQDLLKPTHDRLVKIFSYIINFVRFRESQTAIIDAHFNAAETTKSRIETLYHSNQAAEAHLHSLQRTRTQLESQARAKARRNDELKARLLELKKAQDGITKRLARAKDDKERLTDALTDTTATGLALRQDAAKLRPYVLQSAAALQASLAELAGALQGDRARVDALDRRGRALQGSADTFGVVAADVGACVKVLEDVAGELRKEEEELARAARHRDVLSERGESVREVERTEQLLQRQLGKWIERTERLRRTSRERAAVARERMEELRGVHRRLTEERAEKASEMERRRVRIEQTEKKMVDLRDNVEREIQAALEEYVKMDAHVGLYLREMEQCI
ncbi:MAG: kinetochore-associated Ndc80 complex subunit nuf2 [Peltula sp. TS41687]|nr:MAG: kinetochore-associated Ndc80 complex subunit nuf2 [Peltula sp. TS41687]